MPANRVSTVPPSRRWIDRAGRLRGAVPLGAGVALGVLTSSAELCRVEEGILRELAAWRSSGLTALAVVLAVAFGTGAGVLVLCAGVAATFARRTRAAALRFLALVSVGAGAAWLLKIAVDRARPPQDLRLVDAAGSSFPSGHTAFAVCLVVFVAEYLGPRARRAPVVATLTAVVVVVGASRLYLGVHHPSDVVGSLLVSGGALLLLVDNVRGGEPPRSTSVDPTGAATRHGVPAARHRG